MKRLTSTLNRIVARSEEGHSYAYGGGGLVLVVVVVLLILLLR